MPAPATRPPDSRSPDAWWLAVLLFAVFNLSTSIIFIRLSTLGPSSLATYRLLLACVVLLPAFLADARAHRASLSWRSFRGAVLPGLVFGLHLVTWMAAARMTLAANAVLAVNMVPVVLPFFLFLLSGERVSRREVAATLLAVGGLVVLVASGVRLSGGDSRVKGDLCAIGSMLLLGLYLALGHRCGRALPTNWLYMVPVYLVAGLLCLASTFALGESLEVPRGRELAWVAGIVVLPTICGHGLINLTLRHLRGQVVGVFNQVQFLFSGLLAFAVFGEVPGPLFPVASVLVVAGASLVATGRGKPAEARAIRPSGPGA